jgi:hypothetical protein
MLGSLVKALPVKALSQPFSTNSRRVLMVFTKSRRPGRMGRYRFQMRPLHFQDARQQTEDFCLDFPDDYTISDVMDILADREELDRASMRLSHRRIVLTPETLVEAIETTPSDPIVLSIRQPPHVQAPPIAPVQRTVTTVLPDAVTRRIMLSIAQNQTALENLQQGLTVTLQVIGQAGPTVSARISPAEADAGLRQYFGYGLAEAYARCTGQTSFTLASDEIGRLDGFWREVYDRMAAPDKARVEELARLGLRGTAATQLYMAVGKDVELARAMWQGQA